MTIQVKILNRKPPDHLMINIMLKRVISIFEIGYIPNYKITKKYLTDTLSEQYLTHDKNQELGFFINIDNREKEKLLRKLSNQLKEKGFQVKWLNQSAFMVIRSKESNKIGG